MSRIASWTWTRPPLNPEGSPRAVVTSDLFASPGPSSREGDDRRPSPRLDCMEAFDRLSIGRDPWSNPPPPTSEIRPDRDIYISPEVPEAPETLARTAVIVTPHRSMGRFLLHHYAGSYEPWRFDRVAVEHDGQVEVLSPDQVMLVVPRRWYRLRFGAIYGFVASEIARAYLDAHAHTDLWLWLDDPTMQPPETEQRADEATEVILPEPEVNIPVRDTQEARVIAHAYGHLLAGHPWVLTPRSLADHVAANGFDDVPVDTNDLTTIVKNVMGRLKIAMNMDRHDRPRPSENAAGLMLLYQGILALMGDYVVVLVDDDRTGQVRQERVRIDACHASLQQPLTGEEDDGPTAG